MARPSRKTKVINYCDLNDDEDFAHVKPPASKKARDTITEDHKKPSSHSSQDSQPSADHKTRKPLDQKLYERDLEAAVTLSLLHNTDDDDNVHTDQHPTMGLSPTSPTMGLSPTMHTDQHPTMGLSPTVPTTGLSPTTSQSPTRKQVAADPQGDENQDPSSRRLSNCSVNVNLLGLDEIHAERGSSKRKPPPKTAEPPQGQPKDKDEDYQPQLTPESESEDNEVAESEDEEFTVRKAKKTSKKETRKVEKKTKSPPPPPASKRDKQTPKPSKAKPPATAPAPVRTPEPVRTPASPPVRTPASPPVRTPPPPSAANQVSVPGRQPPAGGSKVPRWTPPGQVGRSPSSSSSPGSGVRSPGQGLRLGLSRRVRVKPLHPSMTSH